MSPKISVGCPSDVVVVSCSVLFIHSLWPPCVADADIIFCSCGYYLLSFFSILAIYWLRPFLLLLLLLHGTRAVGVSRTLRRGIRKAADNGVPFFPHLYSAGRLSCTWYFLATFSSLFIYLIAFRRLSLWFRGCWDCKLSLVVRFTIWFRWIFLGIMKANHFFKKYVGRVGQYNTTGRNRPGRQKEIWTHRAGLDLEHRPVQISVVNTL